MPPLNIQTSIVDFLKSKGQASDLASRSILASRAGIQGFRGTAQQNIQLLKALQDDPTLFQGKTPPTPPPPGIPEPAPSIITGDDFDEQIEGVMLGMEELEARPRPEPPAPPTELELAQQQLAEAEGQVAEFDILNQLLLAQQGQLPLSADEQADIDYIKNSFEQTKDAQQLLNKSREGATRILANITGIGEFAPFRAQQKVDKSIQDGITALNNLTIAADKSLRDTRRALQEKNFADLVDTFSILQEQLDKKAKKVADIKKATLEREKLIAEQVKEERDARNSLIEKIAEAGAPPEIISQLTAPGTTVEQVFQVAGRFFKDPKAALQIQSLQLDIAKKQRDLAAAAGSTAIGGSTPPKAPTGGERDSFRFFQRMNSSAEDLERLEDVITGLSLDQQARLKFAPNFALTSDMRLYRQAQRAFTEARLREDSGAAIPESEFENDRQTYFVQPGDDEAVAAQKERARTVALEALRTASANAYWEFFGESPLIVSQQNLAAVNDENKTSLSSILQNQPALQSTVDSLIDQGFSEADILQIISL